MKSMPRMRTIGLALLVFGMSVCAAAQTSSQSQPETTPAPAPAFGQNPPIRNPQNPPVSGLDEPSLKFTTAAPRSVAPALHLTDSTAPNPPQHLSNNRLDSPTRVLTTL